MAQVVRIWDQIPAMIAGVAGDQPDPTAGVLLLEWAIPTIESMRLVIARTGQTYTGHDMYQHLNHTDVVALPVVMTFVAAGLSVNRSWVVVVDREQAQWGPATFNQAASVLAGRKLYGPALLLRGDQLSHEIPRLTR